MNRIQIIGVRPVSDAEIRAAYYDNHQVCPNCFCRPVETTTLGFVMHHDFKDANQAWCSCGWTGIVDDLLPEPQA